MKKCNCTPPELALELRQNGRLDPPNAGWYCPDCKKEYHQYLPPENMPAEYAKSVYHKWIKVF